MLGLIGIWQVKTKIKLTVYLAFIDFLGGCQTRITPFLTKSSVYPPLVIQRPQPLLSTFRYLTKKVLNTVTHYLIRGYNYAIQTPLS